MPTLSPTRVILLAVLLRLALLAVAYPALDRVTREDTHNYVDLARTLQSHGRFAETPDGPPDTFRTPGYPLFLAASFSLFGPSLWTALILQILLSAGTLALTWLLVSEAASPRTATVATAILAVSPASTFHAVLVLSDTLCAFLVASACLALWRGCTRQSFSTCATGGALLGLSVLVRPIGLYAIPFFIVFSTSAFRASFSRRLLAALLVLAFGLGPPVAWMSRNSRLGAGFLISTIEGMNLLYYKAAPVIAQVDGISWTDANTRLAGELKLRGVRIDPWDGESSRQAKSLALEVFRAHPAALARVVGGGIVRFWAGPGNADLMLLLGATRLGHEARWPEMGSAQFQAAAWALALTFWAVHLAVLLLAACGTVSLARTSRFRELGLLAGTLAVFTLLSAGPGAYARFRVPVEPLLAWLAAAGWCRE